LEVGDDLLKERSKLQKTNIKATVLAKLQ